MLTDSLVAFNDKVIELIKVAQEDLGIFAIFYGDQDKLPGTPVVCVEPDTKRNTLKSAQRGIQIELTSQIIVYHSAITSPATNRRDSDVLAEKIEALLHTNPTMDGMVIHCMAEEVASGYVRKADSIVRSNKIQFTGLSQSRLPS